MFQLNFFTVSQKLTNLHPPKKGDFGGSKFWKFALSPPPPSACIYYGGQLNPLPSPQLFRWCHKIWHVHSRRVTDILFGRILIDQIQIPITHLAKFIIVLQKNSKWQKKIFPNFFFNFSRFSVKIPGKETNYLKTFYRFKKCRINVKYICYKC